MYLRGQRGSETACEQEVEWTTQHFFIRQLIIANRKPTDDSCTKSHIRLQMDVEYIRSKLTRAAPWEKRRSWGCVPAHGGLWGCRPTAPSHPEDPLSALWDWTHPQTPPSGSPRELEPECRMKRNKVKAPGECSALQHCVLLTQSLFNHLLHCYCREHVIISINYFHHFNKML